MVENLLRPDRVLLGGDPAEASQKAVEVLCGIYKRWVPEEKVLPMSTKSAEVAKLVRASWNIIAITISIDAMLAFDKID